MTVLFFFLFFSAVYVSVCCCWFCHFCFAHIDLSLLVIQHSIVQYVIVELVICSKRDRESADKHMTQRLLFINNFCEFRYEMKMNRYFDYDGKLYDIDMLLLLL